jgi:GxxExxY protein
MIISPTERKETKEIISALSFISVGQQKITSVGQEKTTKGNKMTDNDITYQIRGAIYDVYKNLGPGLLESVYEEALVDELEKRSLTVERQKEVSIQYDGHVLKTPLRLDLLVEGRVVVELKSVKEMQDVFWKQTRTYLRLLGLRVGILVNFNTDDILDDSIHRIVNGY